MEGKDDGSSGSKVCAVPLEGEAKLTKKIAKMLKNDILAKAYNAIMLFLMEGCGSNILLLGFRRNYVTNIRPILSRTGCIRSNVCIISRLKKILK